MVLPLEADDPATVGPYTLRARLGAGGMGRVYLAHTQGGRAIALKVVRPDLADDPEFRLRFRREVAAARMVDGMFTAAVVDADPDAVPPWLATVYVPGPSLGDAVRANGPLPETTAWLLLAGVAEALQAVHAAQIIHRDLKPTNVILAADGPRVIDFGIAQARDVTQLTRTGMNVGSPQYMAPEHVLGRELTDAVDVFSLGGVGVFAVTGHSPFGDGPDAAVLYRVVNEQPDLTGVNGDLRVLLAACLAKDPDQRPNLAEILRTCRDPDGAHPVRIDREWLPEPLRHETNQLPPAAVPQISPPRSRRRTWSWRAGVGVVVLCAALAVAWLLHGLGDNRQPAGPALTSPSGHAPPTRVPIGSTVISLRAHANNMFVTAENGGAQALIANRTAIGSWEMFDELDLGNGNIALRAQANGHIVTADSRGALPLIASRTAVGVWETFALVHNADGSISLRAMANGDFVTAENGGSEPLIADRTTIGPWEEFDIVTDR